MTDIAFLLAMVLVIVRATMPETIRNEGLPVPGATAAPAWPAATTGLVLDLLFCVPAILVLVRRVSDRAFTLRFGWSHVAMLVLGGWTLLSVFWASDKFLSIISASHWASALILIWTASQLVESWLRVRLVAGAAFGILLVLLVQGYYYRFIDLPDFQREWKQHQADLLRQRGTDPHSFEAVQLGKNIESGDVTGFSLSRNTYAAMLVLLGMVAVGIAIQRLADNDSPGWIVPIVVILALSLLMLYRYVQSKTAYATPVIGATAVAILWFFSGQVSARTRRLYWIALGVSVLGIAAVVGHGLKHGTLFQLSLTYRWQYWVGAAHLFVHHPWLGVGWANFGGPYLAYRLPQAVEEVKDPHNFFIRAFTELGLIGGLLMLAWMLRLWWELTQNPTPLLDSKTDTRDEVGGRGSSRAAPLDEHDGSAGEGPHRRFTADGSPASPSRSGAIRLILSLAIVAIVLNALISIDWRQPYAWIVLESLKRLMFLLALVVGLGIACLRSLERQELDDRPAKWLLWATLVGLGLFLLHNLIDFSLFEPGPMFVFALLIGSALGVRSRLAARTQRGTIITLIVVIVASIGWLAAATAGVLNIAMAESLAQQADDHVRDNDPAAAFRELAEAYKLVPINGDYAYRAALLANRNPLTARQWLQKAIDADPNSIRYHRSMAELEVNTSDWPHGLVEFHNCVQLDPSNPELRLEFADALRRYGHLVEARQQYQRALELNGLLPATEIRRLTSAKFTEIRNLIRALPDK